MMFQGEKTGEKGETAVVNAARRGRSVINRREPRINSPRGSYASGED
jgi:hypothetical protein